MLNIPLVCMHERMIETICSKYTYPKSFLPYTVSSFNIVELQLPLYFILEVGLYGSFWSSVLSKLHKSIRILIIS